MISWFIIFSRSGFFFFFFWSLWAMAQEQQAFLCCLHPPLVINSNHGLVYPAYTSSWHSCLGSLTPYDFQGRWPSNTWIKNVMWVECTYCGSSQTRHSLGMTNTSRRLQLPAPPTVSRRSNLMFHISQLLPPFLPPPSPHRWISAQTWQSHWVARYI